MFGFIIDGGGAVCFVFFKIFAEDITEFGPSGSGGEVPCGMIDGVIFVMWFDGEYDGEMI